MIKNLYLREKKMNLYLGDYNWLTVNCAHQSGIRLRDNRSLSDHPNKVDPPPEALQSWRLPGWYNFNPLRPADIIYGAKDLNFY